MCRLKDSEWIADNQTRNYMKPYCQSDILDEDTIREQQSQQLPGIIKEIKKTKKDKKQYAKQQYQLRQVIQTENLRIQGEQNENISGQGNSTGKSKVVNVEQINQQNNNMHIEQIQGIQNNILTNLSDQDNTDFNLEMQQLQDQLNALQVSIKEQENQEFLDEEVENYQIQNGDISAASTSSQNNHIHKDSKQLNAIRIQAEKITQQIKQLLDAHTKQQFLITRKINIKLERIQPSSPFNPNTNNNLENNTMKITHSSKGIGEIQLQSHSQYELIYLNCELIPSKQYILKFTVNSWSQTSLNIQNPSEFLLGLIPKSLLINNNILSTNSPFNGGFFKRFTSSSTINDISQDSFEIIKAPPTQQFSSSSFHLNQQFTNSFEMRFCLNANLLEFSTFPGYDTIVSWKNAQYSFKNFPNDQFVVALACRGDINITFDPMEENNIIFRPYD